MKIAEISRIKRLNLYLQKKHTYYVNFRLLKITRYSYEIPIECHLQLNSSYKLRFLPSGGCELVLCDDELPGVVRSQGLQHQGGQGVQVWGGLESPNDVVMFRSLSL